ncbi:MAG: hypothetical protein ACE5D1_02640, partial [Fidelibacterota bacterium]
HLFLIILVFILTFPLAAQQGEEKTIYLKSGEKISGILVTETDSTLTVRTSLGTITLNRDRIKPDIVTVILKNGDVVKGTLLKESPEAFIIQSSLGTITVPASSIERIDFQRASDTDSRPGVRSGRWYFSDERLIDIWFDPTGFPLEENVFYISGFSAAYGFSDRFQLSTRWASWFIGDLNFRPKFMLYKSGDLKKMKAFSIGGHIHTRGRPEYKWEHKTWTESYRSWTEDSNGNVVGGDTTKNIQTSSEWLRIGETISVTTTRDTFITQDGNKEIYENQFADYNRGFGPFSSGDRAWGELFLAYTVSRLKNSGQGRINYNLGASFTFYPDYPVIPRYYAGVDYDARRNLKLIVSVFYDEYYVPVYLQSGLDSGTDEISLPVFIDLGFMYAKDEHWRIGLHFQRPTLAIYYKF